MLWSKGKTCASSVNRMSFLSSAANSLSASSSSYIKGLLGGPTPAEYDTLRQEKDDLKQQLEATKKQLEELQAKVHP